MKKDSNRKSKNHFWLNFPSMLPSNTGFIQRFWVASTALAVVWMPPGHLWWWGGLHSGGESTSTEAHSMFLVFSSNMFLKMIIDDTIYIFAHPFTTLCSYIELHAYSCMICRCFLKMMMGQWRHTAWWSSRLSVGHRVNQSTLTA